MKKLISSLMIAVILFNFIFCSRSYSTANPVFQGDSSIKEDTISSKDMMGLVYDGVANGISMRWNILGHIFGAVAGTITIVINIFPMIVHVGMMIISDSIHIGSVESFTIERAVFNEIPIFNVNYFNFDDSYTIGNTNKKNIELNSGVSTSLKNSVAKFYYIMRLFAVAISLVVLIYVGIRMALSTIAEDKTKYKKMLIGWIESIVLLFVIQYIMVAITEIGQLFGNIFYDLKCILYESRGIKF